MNQKTATGRTLITIDSPDPFTRGKQRSAALGESLAGGLELYLSLFRTVGIPLETVRSDAERLLDAVADWSPDLAAEMSGVAAGAGADPWQIVALNARTEVLSRALGTRPGECSTIARVTDSTFGVQTWDWHEELDPHWHLQSVTGTPRSYVGLTEDGILSKIGMNDAGVSVFLNILGHVEDAPRGMPVHLLTAAVLANASSVAEAIEILSSAPLSTSSALTIMDGSSAVTVELSPAGTVVIHPRNGTLVHTNHFLDDRLGAGEKPGLYDPDSQDRLALVHSRLDRYPEPAGVDEVVQFLYSDPGQPGLCCVPDPAAVFGSRWATLATVTMENGKRLMRVADGSPIDARAGEWRVLTPRT